LGLSTVYGIVKQNSGFINVCSQPHIGTTFRIYFSPAKNAVHRKLETAPTGPDAYGNEVILLVEDEPEVLHMTQLMLERMGYHTLGATSPKEALQMARMYKGRIELLITDVVMPEMNGPDLLRGLLPLYPELKHLLMSGYTANVIANHGILDAGINFIQKPFSKNELAVKVREVLSGVHGNIN
jgi:CheY-like chemotaxis protein